jgi:hypothetical protein
MERLPDTVAIQADLWLIPVSGSGISTRTHQVDNLGNSFSVLTPFQACFSFQVAVRYEFLAINPMNKCPVRETQDENPLEKWKYYRN